MSITVLNDIHIGVRRSAGTTPASQKALADWQFETLEKILWGIWGPLIINGDLFDVFDVDNATLVRTYSLFDGWLSEGEARELVLVGGNHDLAKDSTKLSSFETLARLLERKHDNVRMINGTGQAYEQAWVIPHVANQDLFDLELERVPSNASFVLLHCNYDNNFAAVSDHSLNITAEQAAALPGSIVLGHEHQFRTALDKKVTIVGNQIPTSVADCLGPRFKYTAELHDNGAVGLESILAIDEIYKEIDWRDQIAMGNLKGWRFVRVAGTASAHEAADAITAIAKFRARSDAFVISNAVQVEGATITEGVLESLESAKTFDVRASILDMLTEEERAVVLRLFKEA